MCRLLGYRGTNPVDLRKEILEYPNAMIQQSVCDRDACKPNDDGWGYGFVRGNIFSVIKEPAAPKNDLRFSEYAAQEFDRVMVHIRRASVGNQAKNNTHPFQWDDELIFAHNGSIYGFDQIRHEALQLLSPELRNRIHGETDSEYAMHLFIHYLTKVDQLDSGKLSSFQKAFSETVRTCRALTEKSGSEKPPKLNFMAITKNFLLATKIVHSLGFYDNYMGGTLITSEALTDGDGWRSMEEDTMIGLLANGRYEMARI